jgi:hypothetical protein
MVAKCNTSLVPEAGLEPAQDWILGDFKSVVRSLAVASSSWKVQANTGV